ncbi:MAG: hypothetical protein R2787_18265 [Saprospiraceae bacterium]
MEVLRSNWNFYLWRLNSKMMFKFIQLFTIGFLVHVASGEAQNLQLDQTFGTGGKVIAALGVKDDWIWASALQPDGKLIGAGYSTVDFTPRQAVARFMPDGTLDNSFGVNGSYVSATERTAFAMALHADGTFVTAGSKPNNNFYIGFAVTRFLANGTPDPAFGTNGSVRTSFGTIKDEAYAVAVQADGKVIAGGSTETGNNNNDFALLRYTTAGILDASFGNAGKVVTAIGSQSDEIYSIAIQPDGKILVAGNTKDNGDYFVMARYLTNGTLDPSFGTGGIVKGEAGVGVKAMLMPNGQIIFVGRKAGFTVPDIFVFKYHANGTLDQSYGVNGKAVALGIRANGATIQPDGKVVVVGLKSGLFAVTRFNANGTLDESFGTGGILSTDVSGTQSLSQAHDTHVQPDGKVIVTGEAYKNNKHNMAITRYLPELNVNVKPANLEQSSVSVYPNPTMSSVTLRYSLLSGSRVSAFLTDIQGRILSELISEGVQSAGVHTHQFFLQDELPVGTYMVVLSVDGAMVPMQVSRI